MNDCPCCKYVLEEELILTREKCQKCPIWGKYPSYEGAGAPCEQHYPFRNWSDTFSPHLKHRKVYATEILKLALQIKVPNE